MGNTRRARAGRQSKVYGQKDRIKQLELQVAYLEGLTMSLQAQLSATKMERPPDLDEWVESILPDMDDEERALWDSMSDEAREMFKDELGVKINTEKLLIAEAG